MSRLPLRTIAFATDKAKPMLTDLKKTSSYLPNLLRILANAPAVLETYLTGSGSNARSSLPLSERKAVQITAATIHGCGFYVGCHTDPSVLGATRSRTSADNLKINAIARFTDAVIASGGAVSDEELATFKQAGFDEQAALEVVLVVSRATLCNVADSPGQKPLNEQFEPYR
jgi:alkylhydroperoxidase family enzyme